MSKKKMYKYLVTLRWYIESDEELVEGSVETDEKILNILRHRTNGTSSCSTCPTRNPQGYAILRHHDFMGDKPVYMSTESIQEDEA
ncbi:MAG: hypothetical protein ACE5GH_00845 [Fidelibacterota bacterium]